MTGQDGRLHRPNTDELTKDLRRQHGLQDSNWKKALEQGRRINPERYADFMLNKVSRTFTLNIRVLPGALRSRITMAYLFCRMADTLEDDKVLELAEKVRLLEHFRDLFPAGDDWKSRCREFTQQLPFEWRHDPDWDRLLTWHNHWVFMRFSLEPESGSRVVAACVREMCDGMAAYSRNQLVEGHGRSLIPDMAALDHYCYYVAGTVGNLLCDLFYQHSRLISSRTYQSLKKKAVSFGLGLQLTNILKDIGDDMKRDVFFLPHSLLKGYGITAETFFLPENAGAVKKIIITLIQKTSDHLRDAAEYTFQLPRLEPRLRLFCLWPLFMAVETLIHLSANRARLEGREKAKISRGQVKAVIRATTFACWSNVLLSWLFNKKMNMLKANLREALT